MLLATVPIFAQNTDVTQIFIMRHAEKADAGKDPDLSQAGKERAERLAKLLVDVKVDHLYATPYKRTNQTLMVLAAAQQLQIEESPQDLKLFAQLIMDQKGKTIVVAGHSNTAPILVNLLMAEEKYKQLSEDEFGKIWLVTLKDNKPVACVLLNSN